MQVVLHIFCSLLILFAGSTFSSQIVAADCGTSASLSCGKSCGTDCCSNTSCHVQASHSIVNSTVCCSVDVRNHSEDEVTSDSESCPCSTSDCACSSTTTLTFIHLASNVNDYVLSESLHQSDDLLLSRQERPSSPPPKS